MSETGADAVAAAPVPGTDRWAGFHSAKVTSLGFLLGGAGEAPLLASGGLDRRVILWTPAEGRTGKRAKLEEAHKEGVSALALLPAAAGQNALD